MLNKRSLLSTASMMAIALGGYALGAAPAFAQDANPDIESVVVSASRITSSGFAAPTPTTVLGRGDIEASAQPNLFTTITQLPSLTGSTGTQSGTGGTSGGTNGLSSFSLHNLGTIRTLTLIDGQRVVPANVSGVPDVSEFPQLLIQRVDIVTGGASASWGSDAVGGVINFVTDKNFNGVKGNIQAGTSNYGDDTNGLIQVAGGTSLFDGKGHIEAEAEFYRNDGILGANTPGGALAGGRCCNYNRGTLTYPLTAIPQLVNGVILTTTPTSSTIVACTATSTNCLPQNTRSINTQLNSSSEYGLITSTALTGQAFNADGTLSPFQYGTVPAAYRTPNTTGAAACVATLCVGGDLTNSTQKTTVDGPQTRGVFYTRLSYDLAPDWQVYGTFNFGSVYTFNQPGSTQVTGVAIKCGNAAGGPNAYLNASINASCVANKITSFNIGVSWDIQPQIDIHAKRQQRRYVLGTNGSLDMFGSKWSFDGYLEHGENDTSIRIAKQILAPHNNAAIDAVAGPNGTIICRANAVTITAPGCVPYDVFGGTPLNAAQLAYVAPDLAHGPYSLTSERQEAASMVFNGAPFKDWAGEVAIAFGAEYREEAYNTVGDPYGDGVSTTNPNTATYPSDPTLDPTGANWRAGNFHHGSGNYHVSEGFIEAGVPVMDTQAYGMVDLDLAGRATWYSTSGYVNTWKVGATWDTPLTGLRLRAVQSRDVRAPNLSELFAAPITSNQFVFDRTLPASAPQIQIQNRTVGNANLVPEKAADTELGLVYQPEFLPGFSFSADYYRVAIKQQVGTLTAQQIVDLCQVQLNNAYCGIFYLKGVFGTSNPSYVTVQPFNLAQVTAEGMDYEASYQFDLNDMGIPGSWVVRGLADHVSKFISNSGVQGAANVEAAGAADPLWKINLNESWKVGDFTFNLAQRYFSAGVVNPYGIVCAPGTCPLATAQHPTYSDMNTPAYLYLDIGAIYRLFDNMDVNVKINNVADKMAGPIIGTGNDTIGRTYSIGLRFHT